MCNCHKEIKKQKEYNLKLLNRIEHYKELIRMYKSQFIFRPD